jgi:hypothetical protein
MEAGAGVGAVEGAASAALGGVAAAAAVPAVAGN